MKDKWCFTIRFKLIFLNVNVYRKKKTRTGGISMVGVVAGGGHKPGIRKGSPGCRFMPVRGCPPPLY